MSQRDQTIDVAKGIGMLLVVLGHNPIVQQEKGELYRLIFSFHMPLFFFLSGVFFNPTKSLGSSVVEKGGALLKPYFVTLLSLAALHAVTKSQDIVSTIAGVLYGGGDTIEWSPLWFLPHLFVVSLFAWAMANVVAQRMQSAVLEPLLVLLLFIVGVMLSRHLGPWSFEFLDQTFTSQGLPWGMDLVPLTASYFLLGARLAPKVRHFRPDMPTLAMALTLFAGCHVFWDRTVDLNIRVFDGYLVPLIASISGIYITLAMAFFARVSKPTLFAVSMLGEASLFVLVFHSYFQGKTIGLAAKLNLGGGLPVLVLGFAAGCALPVLVGRLVNQSRHLSKMYLPIRGPQVR